MNFLQLTNDVCQRMNEVELDEMNFTSAIGAHAQIKQAVNAAYFSANTQDSEWPFNHTTVSTVLTPYVNTYYPEDNSPKVSFESFRLYGQNANPRSLRVMDYEEYLSRFFVPNTDLVTKSGTPQYVYQRPDGGFGIYPPPDKAYTLDYDYYKIPQRLVSPLDVSIYPDSFSEALVNGAVAYAYMFRGDPESSYSLRKMFQEDLKALRTLYQNRYEYVRSGQIVRN